MSNEANRRMVGVSTCVDELLVRGLSDWINATELLSVVISSNLAHNAESVALEVVQAVLLEGLMVAGDVTEADGFKPWTLSASEASARIVAEWKALHRFPDPGELVWLSNTDAGDERARSIARKIMH